MRIPCFLCATLSLDILAQLRYDIGTKQNTKPARMNDNRYRGSCPPEQARTGGATLKIAFRGLKMHQQNLHRRRTLSQRLLRYSASAKVKTNPKSTCTTRTKCTESVRMAHLVHVLFHSQSILEGNELHEKNRNRKIF